MRSRKRIAFAALIVIAAAAPILSEVAARTIISKRGKSVEFYRRAYFAPTPETAIPDITGPAFDNAVFTDHPYVPYVFKENARHLWHYTPAFSDKTIDVDINIDAFKLRGPDIALRRPKNGFRILCLGGASTFGYVPEKESWPRRLEKLGRDANPGANVEAINAGVPGFTSSDSLVAFMLRWVELQPDIVIVMHMADDYRAATFVPFRTDYSHIRKNIPAQPNAFDIAPKFFERSAFYCLLRLKIFPGRRNELAFLSERKAARGYDPRGKDVLLRNLRTINAIAKRRNMKAIFATEPYWPKNPPPNASAAVIESIGRYAEWNRAIIDYASAVGAVCIDIAGALPDDRSLYSDSLVPNSAGANAIAETVFKSFEANGLLPAPTNP